MTVRPQAQWLTQWEYAHRGLHSDTIPENSLAAARAAVAQGYGIECDIQRSLDDHPMVFHDWELERLTDGVGLVEDHGADELEDMALLGSDQSPVRLEAFVKLVAGRVPLLVEIKSQPAYDVEWTCLYVHNALGSYKHSYAVMSFDPRVPEWFASNAPETCRGLVGTDSYQNGFEGMWRDTDILCKANADFLAIDRRDLARHEAQDWRAMGRPLLTWTVRTPAERSEAAELADALITENRGFS
ncbi:MAG: glycerophosphodiester phosphodiesterase family protein [Pseudomonadota bacterium]